MLSLSDIERLITVKRREIELEKTYLGLSPPPRDYTHCEDNKENENDHNKLRKQVNFSNNKVLREHNDFTKNKKENNPKENQKEFDDFIPADLERYIRVCTFKTY
ncbi:unnamed protein product [Arctia plantaginis]|uniref:Uncharacterized protein n=1 Tax=Arctia plantaginis TaxID=874455 RepID=A0A8S0Z2K7_ARCPL|nr:unnamed protein product [Arctia plantaginis]